MGGQCKVTVSSKKQASQAPIDLLRSMYMSIHVCVHACMYVSVFVCVSMRS